MTDEKLPLGKRILKLSFAQWIATIGLIISIGGYIMHGEQEHDISVVERDRSIHQRDSIIVQMGLHYSEFQDFKKSYYDHVRTERDQETKADERLDNIETRLTKGEIKFEDFLYWYKPKNK